MASGWTQVGTNKISSPLTVLEQFSLCEGVADTFFDMQVNFKAIPLLVEGDLLPFYGAKKKPPHWGGF